MDDDGKERASSWIGFAMAGFAGLTMFSWVAVQALMEPGKFGLPGRAALTVAFLPTYVQDAWDQAMSFASGEEATRFLSVPRPARDMSSFRPVTTPDGSPVSALMVKGNAGATDRGWRLLGGAMEIDGVPGNAAVLLDPDLVVRNVWTLNEDAVDVDGKSRESRRMLHGLQILSDGSIIHGFDHGSAMQRRDACNRVSWVAAGRYHHSIMMSADGKSVWGLRDLGYATDFAAGDAAAPPPTGLVRLNAETGAVEQEISFEALVAANQGLGVLELARKDENEVETNETAVIGRWMPDPMHFNDVEPLSPAMAAAFPAFEAGDLLVSARDINTVMVIDPDTHKIKWHQTGGFMRQHDPDWEADGTISIFDNNMSGGVSHIKKIDVASHQISVTYDGAKQGFYTRIRGKHMSTARGDLVIVSPQQGRAFELGADGKPVLEFINEKPGSEEQNFVLSEFLWLPETAINPGVFACSNS